MDVKKDYLQLFWPKLKPKIRKHWAKITEDDMAYMNGKSDEFIHVLRKRYGYGKAQAEIEINNWLHQLAHRSSKTQLLDDSQDPK